MTDSDWAMLIIWIVAGILGTWMGIKIVRWVVRHGA